MKIVTPGGIPLVEVILESENPPLPAFKIGNDDSWVLEWREENQNDSSLPSITKGSNIHHITILNEDEEWVVH